MADVPGTKAALHQAHALAQAASLGVRFGPAEQVPPLGSALPRSIRFPAAHIKQSPRHSSDEPLARAAIHKLQNHSAGLLFTVRWMSASACTVRTARLTLKRGPSGKDVVLRVERLALNHSPGPAALTPMHARASVND